MRHPTKNTIKKVNALTKDIKAALTTEAPDGRFA
jgi:hypothetical protein